MLLATVVLLLAGCAGNSTSERLTEFLSSSRKSREKGDIETAIPSIKLACEAASSASGTDARMKELQKDTYEEALKVADSLTGFGHVKPARDVLHAAIPLETVCGISPSDSNSASQKVKKLAEAEFHESQIFEEAAVSRSVVSNDNDFATRRQTLSEIWSLIEKRQFEAAEKRSHEMMASRKKLMDYTNDQGYRESLEALKTIYSAQGRHEAIVKLFTQDAEVQKRGLTKKDLEQADPAAFYKAKFYAMDMIEVAGAQARIWQNEKALQSIGVAENLLRKLGRTTTDLLPCLMIKASILENMDDADTALRYRKECLRIMSSTTETPAFAYIECLQRIATDQEKTFKWQEAVQTYEQVYAILKKHPLKIELAPTFILEGAVIAQRAKDASHVTLFLQRAKEFAEMKRPPHAMGSYYSTLGYFNREGGRYTEAIRDFKTAISYFKKTPHLDWRAHVRSLAPAIALAYSMQERHSEALSEMEQYLKTDNPKSIHEKTEHMRNMSSYADMTRSAGLTAKAHERFRDMVAYMEQQLPTLPGDAPHQYYKAAYQAKRFEAATNSKCKGAECESQQLIQKAIDATRQLHQGAPYSMANTYWKFGTMFFELDELSSAIVYLNNSLSEFEKARATQPNSDWNRMSSGLRYLALAEFKLLRNPQSGEKKITKAMQLIDSEKDLMTYMWNLEAMGDLYENMGATNHDKKLLETSKKYALEAYKLVSKTPYSFEQSVVLLNLAQKDIRLNNLDDAEKFLLQSDQVVRLDHLAMNTQQLATSKALQAHVARKKGDIMKARKLLKEGISEVDALMRHKPPVDCATATIALARVCRKIGLAKESTHLQKVLGTLLATQPISDETRKKRLADCADNNEF